MNLGRDAASRTAPSEQQNFRTAVERSWINVGAPQ
jgi:hypothetical protein